MRPIVSTLRMVQPRSKTGFLPQRANMMKMDMMVKETTDPAMKSQMEMAMGEMTMAMDAKKASKMDECEMHLNKAATELKKK